MTMQAQTQTHPNVLVFGGESDAYAAKLLQPVVPSVDRQHCVVRQPVMRIAGCQWALKRLRGGGDVQRPRLFTVEKHDRAESNVHWVCVGFGS